MQYVIQIQDSNGWLAKCFMVTGESPIPPIVPAGRTQVVMTNTSSYDSIVADYAQYTIAAIFAENIPDIDETGPKTASYPID